MSLGSVSSRLSALLPGRGRVLLLWGLGTSAPATPSSSSVRSPPAFRYASVSAARVSASVRPVTSAAVLSSGVLAFIALAFLPLMRDDVGFRMRSCTDLRDCVEFWRPRAAVAARALCGVGLWSRTTAAFMLGAAAAVLVGKVPRLGVWAREGELAVFLYRRSV